MVGPSVVRQVRVVTRRTAGSARRSGAGTVLSEETVRLVVDVRGEGGELGGVLSGVVGAEQKLPTGHHHADVGLCAATVAAVGRGQGFGRSRCHDHM